MRSDLGTWRFGIRAQTVRLVLEPAWYLSSPDQQHDQDLEASSSHPTRLAEVFVPPLFLLFQICASIACDGCDFLWMVCHNPGGRV